MDDDTTARRLAELDLLRADGALTAEEFDLVRRRLSPPPQADRPSFEGPGPDVVGSVAGPVDRLRDSLPVLCAALLSLTLAELLSIVLNRAAAFGLVTLAVIAVTFAVGTDRR